MLLLIVLLFSCLIVPAQSNPIVEVENGKIEGFSIDLFDGSQADIFLGIPFAKPPIGKLRFEVIFLVGANVF